MRRDLTVYERALQQGSASGAASFPLRDDLARLRRHLDACPRCERRHGERHRRLEGHYAVHKRGLPRGALEGFYESVRERAPQVLGAGGAMSLAFLDAPRSLRIWRSTALAASLLLAVGVGFVVSGRFGAVPGRDLERPLHDARPDLLLQDEDATSRPSSRPTPVVPVTFPDRSFPRRRGDHRFFVIPPPQSEPEPEEAEPAPRWN